MHQPGDDPDDGCYRDNHSDLNSRHARTALWASRYAPSRRRPSPPQIRGCAGGRDMHSGARGRRSLRARVASPRTLEAHSRRGSWSANLLPLPEKRRVEVEAAGRSCGFSKDPRPQPSASPGEACQRFASISKRRGPSGEPISLALSYQLRAFSRSAATPRTPRSPRTTGA